MYEKVLKTPEEMYAFTETNGFGTGFGRGWGLKNFKYIVKNLEPGEQVYFTFCGLHRFYSMSQHKRNFAYAVTDRRIMMGQVRIFNLLRFESRKLSELQNIAVNASDQIGVVTLMFDSGNIGIGVAQEIALNLAKALPQCAPILAEWERRSAALQAEEAESGEAEGEEPDAAPGGEGGEEEDSEGEAREAESREEPDAAPGDAAEASQQARSGEASEEETEPSA